MQTNPGKAADLLTFTKEMVGQRVFLCSTNMEKTWGSLRILSNLFMSFYFSLKIKVPVMLIHQKLL